jgi:acyl-coenzyme A synthetase/AMP-(fatty) acid ligase
MHMAQGGGLLVGDAVPSLQVRVIPDHWGKPHGPYTKLAWNALALTTAPGEIVVAGPHVLTTVGPGEDASLTKIVVDGEFWHRTGDAGYWDEGGRLWLLGRCAAAIPPVPADASQVTLYPFAVESAVHTFSAVKHAALIAHAGQRILALELYTPQDAEWLATLRATLGWAEISDIRILRRMPVDKRHNAKINYPALYKLLNR